MDIWLAYYTDWSGMAVFDSEVDALRYAVRLGAMKVARLRSGQTFGPGDEPNGEDA